MTLRSNIELEDAGLCEIAEEIDLVILEYKATKSKKLRANLTEQYDSLTSEYYKKSGTKNTFHKYLENVK